MIKTMISTFACMLLLIGVSCKKTETTKPVGTAEPSPIVWKWERDYKSLAGNNYIYNNWLIQGINSNNNEFKVVALTLDSGKLVWETENLSKQVYFNPFGREDSHLFNNILILSKYDLTVAISLSNGKILWQDLLESGIRTCIIDDYVYKTTSTEQKSELYRYNIQTGQREFLFAITKLEHGGDIYKPVALVPVKWTDSAGNEHLILHSRGISPSGVWRMDLMSWNLSQKKMDYYHKGVADRASSSRAAIEGNRVYLFSIDKVHCFDAATGNSIWTFERDARDDFSGFKGANVLLVDDKVIAKSDSYWMYGLDKISGKLLWSNDNTSTMPTILREQNDTVWYGSGGVYAVDANTGKVLINGWRYQGKGFWSNAIIPHPSNGTIYATDGEYIYCLDPKYMK